MRLLKLSKLILVLVLANVSSPLTAAEPACADFLGSNKPAKLTFESCQAGKDSQLRVLIATYTVAGNSAAMIEQVLNQKFKLPKLIFKCCGWSQENGYGSFIYEKYNVAVRMHSDETLIRNREDWSQIAKFYVTATLYLEEP